MLGPGTYTVGPGTCAGARTTQSMSMCTVTNNVATEMATEIEAESEAATEIESEPMMESGPILPLMEPAGSGWAGHGHTGQPAGTGVFLRECVNSHCFRAFYPGALPHAHRAFSYGVGRTREQARYLANEWLAEQRKRQPRIEDLYLVQQEACLLESELLVLAKQAWQEFCDRMEAPWQQDDDHTSAVRGDSSTPSVAGAPMSADLGDDDDPIATGWIARETDAMERARAEQRQSVLSEKWEELRKRALQLHADWKSEAETRAWAGLRKRHPGEGAVLQMRLEYLAREGMQGAEESCVDCPSHGQAV